jgi:hypothetical protein
MSSSKESKTPSSPSERTGPYLQDILKAKFEGVPSKKSETSSLPTGLSESATSSFDELTLALEVIHDEPEKQEPFVPTLENVRACFA